MVSEIFLGSSWNALGENVVVQILAIIIIAALVHLMVHVSIEQIVRKVVGYEYESGLKIKIGKGYATKVDEEKREQTLISLFRTAAAVIIWIVAIVVILAVLHVNIAALMTGAGLFGIVIGFGAQNTIKDFLAGIFVIAENQYRVGDVVTLRTSGVDVSGTVEDITIRITKLRDLDGNLHIVQNGTPSVVTNRTFDYANVNVDIGVAYESDVDQVERVINRVGERMAEDDKWSEYIVEPIQFLRVDGFEDSAVRVKALGKVHPAMQWDVAGEFRRRIKKAFEKEGIAIPFPQVVVRR
ncbi:MAG: mechanosensitive ion channel family protein [Candidatus Woesebacteria bacterium]